MWQDVRRLSKDKFKMKKTDCVVLRAILGKRLGQDGVSKTWKGDTTQKVEALHRMYIKTNPKSVTYIRNYRARILRSVLVNNLGFDNSTTLILQKVGHSICGKVTQKMKAWQRQRNKNALYHKKAKYRKTRIKKTEGQYWFYGKKGEIGNKYKKNVE